MQKVPEISSQLFKYHFTDIRANDHKDLNLVPSFFAAKKRSKKALKKYRATSNPQIACPAAPSHTATPFFRLTVLGE
ncbi:MAG TPA: hypothetical protein PKL31_13820 [Fulvivirga sp.]|nr:hypothetical protein [Fulvivirga sp.]